jgi:hypothetical protein
MCNAANMAPLVFSWTLYLCYKYNISSDIFYAFFIKNLMDFN